MEIIIPTPLISLNLTSPDCWGCASASFPVVLCPHSVFLRSLQSCDTDDDVAMCFIKHEAEFNKYIQYLVGRVQAESIVVSKAVQDFYKVRQEPRAPVENSSCNPLH